MSHHATLAARTLLAIIALSLTACHPQEAPRGPTAPAIAKDPQAALALIARGALVIDVRTTEEYADDHLPQAVNIPVQDLPARLPEIEGLVGGDRARPIVVYCGSGKRAAKAKEQLDASGYAHVVNGGGLRDLQPQPAP